MIQEEMEWGHPQLAIFQPAEEIIIIYKANEQTREAMLDYDVPADAILGIIELTGPANIKRIDRVFATKGFGPILYFMANAVSRYIAPNKHDVSDHAKRIWKRLFTDGTKKVSFTSNRHPEEYLNYAYRLDSAKINRARSILRAGKQVNELFMNEFESPNEMKTLLWESADRLAAQKMREIYG
jgi:hypothetical protein